MLQLCKLSNTGSKPSCLVLWTILKHDPTSHLATARSSDSVILRHCARYKSTYYYYYYILLIAPSVCALQTLLDACGKELTCLDMQINTKKSVCIRIGVPYNTECARLNLAQGELLQCRYLGVYVLSGRAFRYSYDHNKCQYFKAFIGLPRWCYYHYYYKCHGLECCQSYTLQKI